MSPEHTSVVIWIITQNCSWVVIHRAEDYNYQPLADWNLTSWGLVVGVFLLLGLRVFRIFFQSARILPQVFEVWQVHWIVLCHRQNSDSWSSFRSWQVLGKIPSKKHKDGTWKTAFCFVKWSYKKLFSALKDLSCSLAWVKSRRVDVLSF